MTLWPLLTATAPIPLHGLAAMAALLTGGVQFALPKGQMPHRVTGYIYVGLMSTVAVSSFFINEARWIGPFGPIHLLSLLVLWTLVAAVRAARRGAVRQHRSGMIQLYLLGLMLAGLFTLLPGRIMHDVVFGG